MNDAQKPKNPAKIWLSRYIGLTRKCKALERAIRAAMEDATNTTVTLKEICVQTSGGGEQMADAVINAVDATSMLEDYRRQTQRAMAEIMEAIEAVPDEVQQTVLIEKYINGRTLQEIQFDIHYEKRQTVKIHGRALWNVWQWMKERGFAE